MACVRRLRWQRGDGSDQRMWHAVVSAGFANPYIIWASGRVAGSKRGVSLNRVTGGALDDVLDIKVQVPGRPRIAITTPARNSAVKASNFTF
jgi:hypothetical protein